MNGTPVLENVKRILRNRRTQPETELQARRFLQSVPKLSRSDWKNFWGDWRAQAVPNVPGGQMLGVLPPSTFATPDWMAFAAEIRGIQEVLRWPLYHYKTYNAAGHTQLQFFDQSEGSATNGRADTNMKSIGQLPGNEMQVVLAIRVVIFVNQTDLTSAVGPPTGAINWYNVLTGGGISATSTGAWLELVISDKEYMVGSPLTLFPSGFGMTLQMASNAASVANLTTSALPNNGQPDNKAIFNMDPPIAILPVRPFKVLLRWQTSVTITTTGKIGPILDGWRVRSVL